jgi:hypothetical protein
MSDPFGSSLSKELQLMEEAMKKMNERMERIKMLYEITKLKEVV